MRIISYNVNGIRAAMNKGFIEWLKTNPADIICVQETKAHKENVDQNNLPTWVIMTIGIQPRKKDIVV